MKKHSKLIIAAAAALTMATSQAAISTGNQVVYVTGSTGFRATVNAAMYQLFGSNALAAWDGGTSYSVANLAGAKTLLWTNCAVTTASGATNVDVAVSWGGSEAGLQCVSCPTNNLKKFPFYDLTKISATGFTASTAGGNMGLGASGTNANTLAAVAMITFADNSQAGSIFHGGTASKDGVTYAAMTGRKVAVIPFNFYANNGFPTNNLSATAYYDTAVGGECYLSEFTGNISDTNAAVFLCGRNVDSGTRVNMQADVHIPFSQNLKQYAIVTSGGAMVNATNEPAGSINGISMAANNNGQSSGGNLAKWLTNTAIISANNQNGDLPYAVSGNTYAISYIALPDACAHYYDGIVPLKYNGNEGRAFDTNIFTNTAINPGASLGAVNYKDQGFTNVVNGLFPYWGYEYIYYNTNNAGTAVVASASTNLYTSLVTTITNYSSIDTNMFGAIQLSDMKVQRTAPVDGGPIVPGAALQ